MDENVKNYYVTFIKVDCPHILIMKFELSLPEDLNNSKDKVNSEETMNTLSFISIVPQYVAYPPPKFSELFNLTYEPPQRR